MYKLNYLYFRLLRYTETKLPDGFCFCFFQYKVVAGSLIGNGGSTPMEVGGDGDEGDVDITMEKLEAEAREVRQFTQDGFSRTVLHSPTQISQSSSAQRQSNKFRQD